MREAHACVLCLCHRVLHGRSILSGQRKGDAGSWGGGPAGDRRRGKGGREERTRARARVINLRVIIFVGFHPNRKHRFAWTPNLE